MEKKFKLPNKKVLVKPVKRKSSLVPAGHENEFLFKHSKVTIDVPRTKTGSRVDPLNKEEREFFESPESGLALSKGDLSVYKQDNNYWKKFRVILDKNVRQLDLLNPMDYITYKVLLANNDIIAPDLGNKLSKGTYKFVIVEEGAEEEVKASKALTKKDAYMLLGKIMDSPTKMRNFLNVYQFTRKNGKSIAPNASKEFLQVETEKILDSDVAGFIGTLKDPSYDTKVLINKALLAKAMIREGLIYKTSEGIIVGNTLQEAVTFFDNDVNNEEILKIKARIENAD